jgi:hypothetical protein
MTIRDITHLWWSSMHEFAAAGRFYMAGSSFAARRAWWWTVSECAR